MKEQVAFNLNNNGKRRYMLDGPWDEKPVGVGQRGARKADRRWTARSVKSRSALDSAEQEKPASAAAGKAHTRPSSPPPRCRHGPPCPLARAHAPAVRSPTQQSQVARRRVRQEGRAPGSVHRFGESTTTWGREPPLLRLHSWQRAAWCPPPPHALAAIIANPFFLQITFRLRPRWMRKPSIFSRALFSPLAINGRV